MQAVDDTMADNERAALLPCLSFPACHMRHVVHAVPSFYERVRLFFNKRY